MAKYHRDPIELICEECQIPFITINARQKYCCPTCASKSLNKKSKSKYKVAVQSIVDNEWKHTEEGIQEMFVKLFSPTCQLCFSKDNVISKLTTNHTDWRVLDPDNWSMLCKKCLDTLNIE